MTIDRRTFLAGSLSALAAARLFAAKKPLSRQLVDACNGRPLAGVRLRVNNLATGATRRLRTAADGSWDYAALLESIRDPGGEEVEVLVRPGAVDGISYAGLRTRAMLLPTGAGERINRRALRLSLVPLTKPFGPEAPHDPALDHAWPVLLSETLFSEDRRPEEAGDEYAYGAITAWQTRKILLLFGESLDEVERAFLQELVPEAVELLTAGVIRAVDGGVWPAEQTPDMAADVPTGAILFVANDDFPRPSVLHRFDSVNPQRIEAAKITLDNLTLRNYFREGDGSPEELAMARHLVQRSVAGALGYSATMALPNRTLLDATALTDGIIVRTGIRPEDVLLARMLYGSGWIAPGARMTIEKDSIVNAITA